jgi:FAD/FMN-containing dehydrogenase
MSSLLVGVGISDRAAPGDDPVADTIMVRTGALRDITIDPAPNAVKVGAGVLARDLAAALSPHGLAASLGSGPTKGVAGFAMFRVRN